MTFSFELHSGESAACEKGERGDKDFERQGGLGKRGQQRNAVRGGGEEGIKCVKFGARGSSMAQGFLNKEDNLMYSCYHQHQVITTMNVER